MSTIQQPAAPVAAPEYRVPVWQWIASIFIPIVGFICAIVALTRGKIGPGLGLLVAAAISCSIWYSVALNQQASATSSYYPTSSVCVDGYGVTYAC